MNEPLEFYKAAEAWTTDDGDLYIEVYVEPEHAEPAGRETDSIPDGEEYRRGGDDGAIGDGGDA